MPRYGIQITYSQSYDMTVTADSLDEAIKGVYDEDFAVVKENANQVTNNKNVTAVIELDLDNAEVLYGNFA